MNPLKISVVVFAVIGYSVALFTASVLWERSHHNQPLVAEVDKETIIYQAISEHPNMSGDDLASAIEEPMVAFLNSWVEKGYVIYSIRSDANGKKQLAIEAMPPTVDLTDPLEQVVNAALAKKATKSAP